MHFIVKKIDESTSTLIEIQNGREKKVSNKAQLFFKIIRAKTIKERRIVKSFLSKLPLKEIEEKNLKEGDIVEDNGNKLWTVLEQKSANKFTLLLFPLCEFSRAYELDFDKKADKLLVKRLLRIKKEGGANHE